MYKWNVTVNRLFSKCEHGGFVYSACTRVLSSSTTSTTTSTTTSCTRHVGVCTHVRMVRGAGYE